MAKHIILSPPQQMFVEWRCGDIKIELFDGPTDNEKKVEERKLGERDMNHVERKQFFFDVKPLESGESQKYLKFTLDQKESPSYPTRIRFILPYDAAGAPFLPMHASVQAAGVPALPGFDLKSDETFDRLSRHMPAEKYTSLCTGLGIEYNEANNILCGATNDYQRATRSCLAHWQTETGGNMDQLKTILQEIGVGDLAKYIE
ncbi:uncharacterized protein LOC105441303 [Strongylocentrotus purpuratus]|uniref:Death domain-containing protein n=1 Tax=Strongylocentrotus purpuratus TaxID=7668 RepID=A0A7M7PE14_STRPU|nr:uncharacterized protein LOC105441303 [Strongylocentrotus purpuratus]|eukprot:XP_011670613.1 PREDICTED: uncharacterized protein LOC105441303 [Strongylocentrotus purpuratus]